MSYFCADCAQGSCRRHDAEHAPKNCPSFGGETDFYAGYEGEEREIARVSAIVESSGYGRLTRIEEIMDFCKRMGYRKLGFAFCMGLHNEAKVVARIFRENGFDVVSVGCKVGSADKTGIGVKEEEKQHGGFEAMCNPVWQAKLLNGEKTDFNIILGLCVGHDTLFIRHTQAPMTVLAVKDRVTGHNPLAAVYLADGFYKKLHTFSKDHGYEE